MIEFLEEIANNNQTITISPEEVSRLVARCGPRVRQMGQWNNDGSLAVPMSAVTEALRTIGGNALAEAVSQLKARPERFSDMLETSSASTLIEKVAAAYTQNLKDLVTRFQETTRPAEADKLWTKIDEALFGR